MYANQLYTSYSSYDFLLGRYAKGADWWTLSDNVESTVIFFIIYFQFITAALIFTFGSTFRRPVYFNVLTVVRSSFPGSNHFAILQSSLQPPLIVSTH